jgi:hypothetical protein
VTKQRVEYYEPTVVHATHVLDMAHVKMVFVNAIKIILTMAWQSVPKPAHHHPMDWYVLVEVRANCSVTHQDAYANLGGVVIHVKSHVQALKTLGRRATVMETV